MTSIVVGMKFYCAGAQDSCTTTIRDGLASNAINSITPSSKTVNYEFHFKKIPGDSPGLSEGRCKHMANLDVRKERKLSFY